MNLIQERLEEYPEYILPKSKKQKIWGCQLSRGTFVEKIRFSPVHVVIKKY